MHNRFSRFVALGVACCSAHTSLLNLSWIACKSVAIFSIVSLVDCAGVGMIYRFSLTDKYTSPVKICKCLRMFYERGG